MRLSSLVRATSGFAWVLPFSLSMLLGAACWAQSAPQAQAVEKQLKRRLAGVASTFREAQLTGTAGDEELLTRHFEEAERRYVFYGLIENRGFRAVQDAAAIVETAEGSVFVMPAVAPTSLEGTATFFVHIRSRLPRSWLSGQAEPLSPV